MSNQESYQVSASNARGDFVLETYTDKKAADVRHIQLWNEVDDSGLLKWGTVRTTTLCQ